MDTNEFRSAAKDMVVNFEKEMYNRDIEHQDIQVVFMSYVMGYMKTTMVIPADTQDRYYEISYSFINRRMYLDIYQKIATRVKELG